MVTTALMDSALIFAPIGLMLLFSVISVIARSRWLGFITSSIFLLLTLASSAYLFIQDTNLVIEGFISLSHFSLFFIGLFSFTIFLVNLLSFRYSKDYPALAFMLGLVMAGAAIIPAATSLIEIFLGIDLIVIVSSMMILISGKKHVESAVKFFLLGSISIAVFAFALALIFPSNPELSIAGVTLPSSSPFTILSLLTFVAALGFDTALFPFNLWVPDAYEGAPGNITALLAGVNKKVAFVALLEVAFVLFSSYSAIITSLFTLLAIVTMFFGNLVAMVQSDVKRMFAYSSISQAGYIAVGLATATQFGMQSSVFYIVAHSFMIIGTFALILWLEGQNVKSIGDYSGLYRRNLFASVALTIFMLSMAGIPPLIGFDGKLLLFSSALQSNLLILAILGVINSFLSIYYYGKVMMQIFQPNQHKGVHIDKYVGFVVLVCLLVVVLVGIYPQPLISATSSIAGSFFTALP